MRRVGSTARDLDPAHRRDGAGLLLVAGAIVVAAGVWWRLEGPVGDALVAGVVGLFGRLAVLVPIVMLATAWRLMRDPLRNGPGGQLQIGTATFVIGAAGLAHVVAGVPLPASGAESMRAGGGWLGFFAAAPIVDLVTSWVAVPILLLVAVYGLLLLSGTPVYALPGKAAATRARFRQLVGGGSATSPQGSSQLGTSLETDGDPIEAYSTGRLRRHRPRSRVGSMPGDETVPEPAGLEQPADASELAEGRALRGRTGSVPPGHSPVPPRTEQLVLSGDVTYHLPSPDVLHTGAPHKTRSKANDVVVESLTRCLLYTSPSPRDS